MARALAVTPVTYYRWKNIYNTYQEDERYLKDDEIRAASLSFVSDINTSSTTTIHMVGWTKEGNKNHEVGNHARNHYTTAGDCKAITFCLSNMPLCRYL